MSEFAQNNVFCFELKRNAYIQVPKIDRGRIVVYRKCGLPLRDIVSHMVDIHSMSCKYGVNGLLRIILNGMLDLNILP